VFHKYFTELIRSSRHVSWMCPFLLFATGLHLIFPPALSLVVCVCDSWRKVDIRLIIRLLLRQTDAVEMWVMLLRFFPHRLRFSSVLQLFVYIETMLFFVSLDEYIIWQGVGILLSWWGRKKRKRKNSTDHFTNTIVWCNPYTSDTISFQFWVSGGRLPIQLCDTGH